jgi:hypothetical protein
MLAIDGLAPVPSGWMPRLLSGTRGRVGEGVQLCKRWHWFVMGTLAPQRTARAGETQTVVHRPVTQRAIDEATGEGCTGTVRMAHLSAEGRNGQRLASTVAGQNIRSRAPWTIIPVHGRKCITAGVRLILGDG